MCSAAIAINVDLFFLEQKGYSVFLLSVVIPLEFLYCCPGYWSSFYSNRPIPIRGSANV